MFSVCDLFVHFVFSIITFPAVQEKIILDFITIVET